MGKREVGRDLGSRFEVGQGAESPWAEAEGLKGLAVIDFVGLRVQRGCEEEEQSAESKGQWGWMRSLAHWKMKPEVYSKGWRLRSWREWLALG